MLLPLLLNNLLEDENTDNLLADDVQSTSEVSGPSIGQVHALTADDVESTSEFGAPTLAQNQDDLLANDIESVSRLSLPALSDGTVQPKSTGGRSGKRKRYVVEVEGEFFEVASVQAAQEVLQQLRDIAEESAKKDVTSAVTPKPPRVSIKTGKGKATQSAPLKKAVKQTQKKINRAYVQAARAKQRDTEIAQLITRKLRDEQEEEEAKLLLLL